MIKNILELIEKQLERCPNKVAFEDEQLSITYKELVTQAKTIGSALKEINAYGQPVAVVMPKSVKMLVAFFGVIYSGNYYVPIDEKLPSDRINMMLEILQPIMVITNGENGKVDSVYNTKEYDKLLLKTIDNKFISDIREKSIDTDPVYALFTSGSTGVPKGVVVNHKSVISYSDWVVETFQMDTTTILGNQTPFYFSMSVLDIYSTINSGATMCLIPKKYFAFPIDLVNYLNEKKINMIYWVPSALGIMNKFKILGKIELPYLKKVLFAGENMPTKNYNEWYRYFPNITYANLYGPTEITDIGTFHIVTGAVPENENIPIGRFCSNMDGFVLDEDNHLVSEVGKKGELYFRGTFLAMGYLGDMDKTKDKFVQNPINNRYPELVYKTGDIVTYNQLGELVYVGRKDHQVKHMGNRIELGDIETHVLEMEEVITCACLLDEERDWLILYYQSKTDCTQEIKKMCKSKLPDYMVPNKIIFMNRWPLNANGKTNRKELQNKWNQQKTIQ